MNKNTRFICSIMMTLPFLISATYKSIVYSRSYKDFELTYQRTDVVGDEEYYYYYTLKNKGDGYISQTSLEIGHAVYSKDYFSPFNNCVFSPKEEYEIAFKDDDYVLKPEKLKTYAYAYANFETDLTVGGSKVITFVHSGEDYYLYNIDITLDGERSSKYNYGIILEVTYEASTYYLKIDDMDGFSISASEELDLNKLNVVDIKIIKSTTHYDEDWVSNMIFGIIEISFIAMYVGAGIFCAIFFPARARRRRRRRMLQEKQKAKESNESCQ